MSEDLISRSALLAEFEDFKDMDCPSGHTVTADYMIELAEDAPAVDAEPVRRGEWLNLDYSPAWAKCSECGCCWEWGMILEGNMAYCPNCGAKMMDAEVEG